MDMITGWKIFLKSVCSPKVNEIGTAAEWMYRLNVMARSLGNQHVMTDIIYELKNELIRHLYQSGYATEVKQHLQKRVCHACGGTGEYFTGAECYRCDGTGVYGYTRLVAFRFCVDGHSYSWHQLEKLIDYPVTFTQEDPEPFKEPIRRDDAILKMDEAWRGCCVVWWSLLFNGDVVRFYLFEQTWQLIKRKLGIYALQRWWSSAKRRTQKTIKRIKVYLHRAVETFQYRRIEKKLIKEAALTKDELSTLEITLSEMDFAHESNNMKTIFRFRKALRTLYTNLTFETIMKAITMLVMAATILFLIFYDPILRWIWCNVFQRCFEGVPF